MNRSYSGDRPQQPGSNRDNDDRPWENSRQASQWQEDEPSRQAGGSRDQDRDDIHSRERFRNRDWGRDRSDDDYEGRYSGESRGQSRPFSGRGRPDDESQRRYGLRSRYDQGQPDIRGASWSRENTSYPTRDFDASGGNDYGSFTSEDYGGRDFYAQRGRLSGGMRSSDTYRPSYGIGSGSRSGRSGDDYGSWREYGESRGFFSKAGDEIASWFGDEDAARRREQDHRGRGPSDYTRSDERIREDVNDALTHDWRVDASQIRVSVKDGEVSLDGTVSAREAKRRAEDLADNISGVKHVQNNIRVTSGISQSSSQQTAGQGASSTETTGSTGSSGTSALGATGRTTGSTTGSTTP